MMNKIYGGEFLSVQMLSSVREKEFETGERRLMMIQKWDAPAECLAKDCYTTIRVLAERSWKEKATFRRIIIEDFEKKNWCVSHALAARTQSFLS